MTSIQEMVEKATEAQKDTVVLCARQLTLYPTIEAAVAAYRDAVAVAVLREADNRLYESLPTGMSEQYRAGFDAARGHLHSEIASMLAAFAPAPVAPPDDPRIYPCKKCGMLRSKAEGGTTFTVCDACWDKLVAPPAQEPICAYTGCRRTQQEHTADPKLWHEFIPPSRAVPPAQEPETPCNQIPHNGRVCERGTHGCSILHQPAAPSPSDVEPSGPEFISDTITRLSSALRSARLRAERAEAALGASQREALRGKIAEREQC